MQTTTNRTNITPPSAPAEWSLQQIQQAISRQLPKSILATRKQGGQIIPYIPWYEANRILDKYAPGWCWEITRLEINEDRLFIIGRLTLPTTDGVVWREASGTEMLKEWSEKKQSFQELGYGDPSSNAESMAFRRAAARFGLGLYLYERD